MKTKRLSMASIALTALLLLSGCVDGELWYAHNYLEKKKAEQQVRWEQYKPYVSGLLAAGLTDKESALRILGKPDLINHTFGWYYIDSGDDHLPTYNNLTAQTISLFFNRKDGLTAVSVNGLNYSVP